MARWRIAVGAGIVIVLAAVTAFVVASALRGEPEVVASEPVAAAPSPIPSATADSDPMPELQNTGENFDQIIRSIEEFRNWLFRHPDPELVDLIYSPECPCHEIFSEKLHTLRVDKVRFASNEVLIHDIVLMDYVDGVASVRLVDEGKPTVVVNQSGEIVDRGSGWEPRAYRVLLKQSPDTTWRVSDLDEMAMDAEFPRYDDG